MKKQKSKQEHIIIPKKAFIPIVCLMPLAGVIIAKGNAGALVVLIIGVTAGIFIGKGFFEK
ncbi:hypothetical protein HOD75_01675 [archaeon]|jgi:hypothetical protein|nr:hypothetical protein [archaeon]MBT4241587.1 hypothetical protein [archaeon]MBT4417982.1 hypothetical protein [archaeon]